MLRIVIGIGALMFMVALTLFLRHQYNYVMRRATSPQPNSIFGTSDDGSQQGRRKCLVCGGTGRITIYPAGGAPSSSQSRACPTCNGAGWIDDSQLGR